MTPTDRARENDIVQRYVNLMCDAIPTLKTTPAKLEIIKAGLRACIVYANAIRARQEK